MCTVPTHKHANADVLTGPGWGRTELEGLALSYPAQPEASVLKGLSFSVNPGEVMHLSIHSG